MRSKKTIQSLTKKQSIFKYPNNGVIRERLLVSDYLIREKRPSQIDVGAILTRTIGMKCPHCGTHGEEIEHGHVETCIKCGLIMEVHGNALDCTLEMLETNYATDRKDAT
jgi:hypothetical protein